MAKVDDKGYWHPTEDDEPTYPAMAHIAFCPVCNHYALAPPE